MEKVRFLPAGKGGRKTDKWIAPYRDADNNRLHRQFDTETEAKRFQIQVMADVQNGDHIPVSDSLTIEAGCDRWFADGLQNREPTTLHDYKRSIRLHVVPYIGSVKLAAFDRKAVMAFIGELRKPAKDYPKGRSTHTIKRTLVTLRSMLSFAVHAELVRHNVLKDMGDYLKNEFSFADRQEGADSVALKVGVDIPTADEVTALTQALGRLANPIWRPLFLAAIFTGMRISELVGLRWEDVDFESKVIRVRQRIDRFGNPGRVKSKTSRREIPFPDDLGAVLLDWRTRCPKRTKEEVIKPRDKSQPLPKSLAEPVLHYVFPTKSGEAQTKSNPYHRGLSPAWVAAGVVAKTKGPDGKPLPKYTGHHTLRHFATSWMINPETKGGRGIEPVIAMKWLGHSDLEMITKVYGHAFEETETSRAELNRAAKRLLGTAA